MMTPLNLLELVKDAYTLSKEFDTLIGMVNVPTLENLKKQYAIIRSELEEVIDSCVAEDYEGVRDGILDVIKTVIGLYTLNGWVPNISLEAITEYDLTVDDYKELYLLAQEMDDELICLEEGNPLEVSSADYLLVHALVMVCVADIEGLFDYHQMHLGLMSRFDSSMGNALLTKDYYATNDVETYIESKEVDGVMWYCNKLKSSQMVKGRLEVAGKMMKSKFFSEPDYTDSASGIHFAK